PQSRDWPKSPNALAGRLRRAATNLRKAGIEVAFHRDGQRGRTICVTMAPQPEKDGKSPSSSSPGAKRVNGGKELGGDDDGDDVGDGGDGGDVGGHRDGIVTRHRQLIENKSR